MVTTTPSQQEAAIRVTGRVPHAAEVDSVKKERQQPDRQDEDEGCAKSRRH